MYVMMSVYHVTWHGVHTYDCRINKGRDTYCLTLPCLIGSLTDASTIQANSMEPNPGDLSMTPHVGKVDIVEQATQEVPSLDGTLHACI